MYWAARLLPQMVVATIRNHVAVTQIVQQNKTQSVILPHASRPVRHLISVEHDLMA